MVRLWLIFYTMANVSFCYGNFSHFMGVSASYRSQDLEMISMKEHKTAPLKLIVFHIKGVGDSCRLLNFKSLSF